MEKLSLLLIYAVHLVLITWISVVICIVIANTNFANTSSEAYLEPYQKSMMELFMKIVNG